MKHNKSDFSEGFESALYFRKKPYINVIPGVRWLNVREPYTIIWHSETSFTITWTSDGINTQGLIMEPDIFPVKMYGKVETSGQQQANFQYGVCEIEATMPWVIQSGDHRLSYTNAIPKRVSINDVSYAHSEANLHSVFCGEVYTDLGTKMSLTVAWGGADLPETVSIYNLNVQYRPAAKYKYINDGSKYVPVYDGPKDYYNFFIRHYEYNPYRYYDIGDPDMFYFFTQCTNGLNYLNICGPDLEKLKMSNFIQSWQDGSWSSFNIPDRYWTKYGHYYCTTIFTGGIVAYYWPNDTKFLEAASTMDVKDFVESLS